jgi:serine/threonine protein kinase
MPFCPQCRNENPELGAKCPRCADRYYVYEEALADAEEDSYIGQKVADKFVIVDRISEGGMGTVYRALQLPVEREVALKVLRTELEDSTEVRNRFIREARAVSKINHPNIITLHDFGFDESDYPYMVMEYAPGQSLDKWIYERGITLERIVHVARQFLSALADAHDQGIVHRDLKPENIVVTGTGTDDDFIKLLDFGIARLVNEQATTGLTREGEVFGTPHYMSPEQAEGETGIGPEADVYAIGIMIYEMLCREAPFDAPKPLSILFKQINEDLPELKPRAEITTPDPVEDLVRRATRKDPDERFANAGEMLRALNQLADPESSNIIQVPTDASGVGNEESETMIGTGTRAVPENKEQREEVGTANTLGFDDSNPEPPDKILSAESDEDEEELPADADVEIAGYESDRKRRIALVGGAVLLVGAALATLLLTGSDDDGAVAVGDRDDSSDETTAASTTGAEPNRADAGSVPVGSDDTGDPSSDDVPGEAGAPDTATGPETGRDEPPLAKETNGTEPSGSTDDRTGGAPTHGGSRPSGTTEESGADEAGGSAASGGARGGSDEPSTSPGSGTEPPGSGMGKTADSDEAEDENEDEKEVETEKNQELETFGAPEENTDDEGPDQFAPPE